MAPEVRLPPQDIEAEEAILGAMLMSPDGVDDVLSMMQASHFYKTHNGFIFRAMSDLFEDGHPIDTLTVTNCLDQPGEIDWRGILSHRVGRESPFGGQCKSVLQNRCRPGE